MRRRTILWVLLACALVPAAGASLASDADAPRLFGIARVVVAADSIVVTRNGSSNDGLVLIPAGASSGTSVDTLTIKVGGSFSVSDRHHLDTEYRLLKIAGETASIEAIQSTRFPGEAEQSLTETLLIRTYGAELLGK